MAKKDDFGMKRFIFTENIYYICSKKNISIMNEAHETQVASIAGAFCEAIEQVKNNDTFSLSDMFVIFKSEEQLLSLYDDNEMLLTQIGLEEYDEAGDTDNIRIIALLRQALEMPEVADAFRSLDAVAPISVILLNDEKEIVSELKTFDDEKIFLDDDFLKKAGKELDDFFDQLMADIK